MSNVPSVRAAILIGSTLMMTLAAAAPAAGELQLRGPHVAALPPAGPPLPLYPVQLVGDDGTFEGAVGVGAPAEQFMWFQTFASPAQPFLLEEVWVLFDDDDVVDVGAAIQIALYHDPDGDPTNGATLLAAFDATVEDVTGTLFSVYPVPVPPQVPAGGDVYVGVVNRFVSSGVTPANQPATVDLGSPQGRSWIVQWTGDPPDPPNLPADGSMQLLAGNLAGNWMIRAFGTPIPPSVLEVPTASSSGLALLAVLLAWVAVRRLS